MVERADGIVHARLGAEAAERLSNTGVMTLLHEEGHFVAFHACYSFPEGEGPYIRVYAFDGPRKIINAEDWSGSYRELSNWLDGTTANNDGTAGYTAIGRGFPRRFARKMGRDGTQVFVSAAGPAVNYAINTSAACAGIAMRHDHPRTAAFLVGFAAAEHVRCASYPISAAFMSPKVLARAARDGHDFAGIAVHLSRISGFAAPTIATTVAIVWVSTLPLLALGLYYATQQQGAPQQTRGERVFNKIAIVGISLCIAAQMMDTVAHFAPRLQRIADTMLLSQPAMQIFSVANSAHLTYLDKGDKRAMAYSAAKTLIMGWTTVILLRRSSLLAGIIGTFVPPLLDYGRYRALSGCLLRADDEVD